MVDPLMKSMSSTPVRTQRGLCDSLRSYIRLGRKSYNTGLSRKLCDVIFNYKLYNFSILINKKANIKLFFK
jgi:hypothetical protein